MPSTMRLHMRSECPVEDTPPSTRPSSAASSAPSTSGAPHRSTSMDSINTSSSAGEKPSGEEIIPTRMTKTTPKVNANAMQFVKTGPANLHRSAKEQMKKAQVVKSLRKTSLQEEEEWQSTRPPPLEEGFDWQSNLDKWKSSRRKKNEDVLERVIEVKKYEQEDSRSRRKSKTFSEMREETGKKGRRYNLVVHNDDNNDLSDLGLVGGGSNGAKSEEDLSDLGMPEEVPEIGMSRDSRQNEEPKDDYKDAKSDAGFCTGSDTASDGASPEDNISDTSSAVDEKKEPLSSKGVPEYTYDKAIEDYKQYAENTAKRQKSPASSQSPSVGTIEDKLAFLTEQSTQPRVVRRHKLPKVDLDKRRSMFELRNLDSDDKVSNTSSSLRKPIETRAELKTRVMSFENLTGKNDSKKSSSVVVPRDTNFKQKLASFSLENVDLSSSNRSKKTPERDQNFYKKLQSFTEMEVEKTSSSLVKSRTLDVRKSTSFLHDRISNFENFSPSSSSSNLFSSSFSSNSLSRQNLSETSTSKPPPPVKPERSFNRETSNGKKSQFNNIKSQFNSENSEIKVEKSQFKSEISSSFMNEDNSHLDELRDSHSPSFNENSLSYNEKSTSFNEKSTSFNENSPFYNENSPSYNENSPSFNENSPSYNEDSLSYLENAPSYSDNSPSKFSVQSSNCSQSFSSKVQDRSLKAELSASFHSPSSDNLESRRSNLENFSSSRLEDSLLLSTQEENLDSPFISAPGPIFSKQESSGDSDSPPELPPTPPTCPPPPLDVEREIEAIEACVIRAINGDYQNPPDTHIKPQDNYEVLSEAGTGQEDLYCQEEPVYERINEPVYENIYEKVNEPEHQYQTLQEVTSSRPSVPALPPKNPSVFEVVDESWTTPSQALPPSVPPPPPPAEESEDNQQENCAPRTDSAKQVLRQKMSDFLGSQPPKKEAMTMQPPPDVFQMLRQEREDERLIVQKQHTMARESPLIDPLMVPQPYRPKYTWEDRMKADQSSTPNQDLDESTDQFEFQTKLSELEQEMEKHDRSVLQRMKEPPPALPPKLPPQQSIPPPAQYSERPPVEPRLRNPTPEFGVSGPKFPDTTEKPMSFQEFYTAPPFLKQNNKENIYSNDIIMNSINSYRPPPEPPKQPEPPSWPMRRKPDAPKKNYNSHWLIQEAEQRRLEQQDRISRQKPDKSAPPFLPFPNFPQNLPSDSPPDLPLLNPPTTNWNHQNTNNLSPDMHAHYQQPDAGLIHNNYQRETPVINHAHYQQDASPPIHSSFPPNMNYQREASPKPVSQSEVISKPTNHKSLPDAIINTITQRVKNKNNLSNGGGSDESFHDYMNTSDPTEEQRLLSVSGKKKCSHCAEELGRGAAMIIESLRLFYHIPCFKCCVCGIQLGNGTSGADVRVRNHKLHCHNCYSNDEGMKFSKV